MSQALSPQQRQVLDFLACHPDGLTDEQGAQLSGVTRFGRVRHELKVRGLVIRTSAVKPHIWKAI